MVEESRGKGQGQPDALGHNGGTFISLVTLRTIISKIPLLDTQKKSLGMALERQGLTEATIFSSKVDNNALPTMDNISITNAVLSTIESSLGIKKPDAAEETTTQQRVNDIAKKIQEQKEKEKSSNLFIDKLQGKLFEADCERPIDLSADNPNHILNMMRKDIVEEIAWLIKRPHELEEKTKEDAETIGELKDEIKEFDSSVTELEAEIRSAAKPHEIVDAVLSLFDMHYPDLSPMEKITIIQRLKECGVKELDEFIKKY
ncbi:MAG: hypothetical protein HW400_412 [Candidatus Levybacteria bacterium]|nr:hypothetical protein [Candidatus Levybacteria bacterium]